jgi:hypothetical protein
MRGRGSPCEEVAELAVEMTGFAPYNSVDVRELGEDKGYEACLPAPPVRKYRIHRVDRYFVPDGCGAFVLVPEGGEIPVVPRSAVDGSCAAAAP